MKKIIPLIISALISIIAFSNENENRDAIYLKLVKEYTLNPDGSFSYTCEKQMKLLTHFAFHSLYGETFIIYNTGYQELNINHAYTIMANGKKVVTPENAFNNVLPGFANHAPAYNQLREMVVTHTGLEVGAVIYLSYTLHNNPGFFPAFMGEEIIGEPSPVNELVIRVRVPEGQELHQKTWNIRTAPEITNDRNTTVYTWTFKNLKAIPHEKNMDENALPRIIFSTAKDLHRVYDAFVNQESVRMTGSKQINSLVKEITAGSKNDLETMLKIQDYMVNNIANWYIPLKYIGFKIRPATEIIASNGGTVPEKVLLMCVLLKEAGINAIPVMVFPEKYFDRETGCLLPVEDYLVQVNPREKKQFYLSACSISEQNLSFGLAGKIMLQIDAAIESLRTFKVENQESIIELESGIVIENAEKYNGSLSLLVENYANPFLKLFQDPDYAKGLTDNYASKANILNYTISSSGNEKSVISYEIEGKKAFSEQEGYYFLEFPEVKNNIYSQGYGHLASMRETAMKLKAPVREKYTYSVVIPDELRFVNPEQEIKIENQAGKVIINYKIKGNVLLAERELHIPSGLITIDKYNDFRSLMLLWYNSNYRQAVIGKK